MAKERLRDGDDPSGAYELVGRAHDEAKQAIGELRSLVRGIHPQVLTDRGLDAALSSLAARSTVPVTIDVHLPERPPPAIEAAAYFVVAEAMANLSKHSNASRASVRVEQFGPRLLIDVRDDGRAARWSTPAAGCPAARPGHRGGGHAAPVQPEGRTDRGPRRDPGARVSDGDGPDARRHRRGLGAAARGHHPAARRVRRRGGRRTGRRQPAARRGARDQARPGDRRRAHAADVHRRGPARRGRAALGAAGHAGAGAVAVRRGALRHRAARRLDRRRRLPAEGARRRRQRLHQRLPAGGHRRHRARPRRRRPAAGAQPPARATGQPDARSARCSG